VHQPPATNRPDNKPRHADREDRRGTGTGLNVTGRREVNDAGIA
jgi:hypothetical protein